MFGLFKKKEKGIPVTDKIWMYEKGKWQACLEHFLKFRETVFIAWFPETQQKLRLFFESRNLPATGIQLAGFVHSIPVNGPVIFLEHFPLQEEEQNKFRELNLAEAVVYCSMDEPIFESFGGSGIISLMQKMGMNESEMMEHDMISTSIKRAQQKIADKAIITGSANSQRNWLLNAGMLNEQ